MPRKWHDHIIASQNRLNEWNTSIMWNIFWKVSVVNFQERRRKGPQKTGRGKQIPAAKPKPLRETHKLLQVESALNVVYVFEWIWLNIYEHWHHNENPAWSEFGFIWHLTNSNSRSWGYSWIELLASWSKGYWLHKLSPDLRYIIASPLGKAKWKAKYFLFTWLLEL